tara:strand:+ start:22 stop:282 length:261 start_codon:yes stop_codon:yes gene_type:complete
MGLLGNMLAKSTKKAMMRYYTVLNFENPGMSEDWYIKKSLSLRFKRWSESDIIAFTTDCLTMDQLSEKIILYESSGLVTKYTFDRL